MTIESGCRVSFNFPTNCCLDSSKSMSIKTKHRKREMTSFNRFVSEKLRDTSAKYDSKEDKFRQICAEYREKHMGTKCVEHGAKPTSKTILTVIGTHAVLVFD